MRTRSLRVVLDPEEAPAGKLRQILSISSSVARASQTKIQRWKSGSATARLWMLESRKLSRSGVASKIAITAELTRIPRTTYKLGGRIVDDTEGDVCTRSDIGGELEMPSLIVEVDVGTKLVQNPRLLDPAEEEDLVHLNAPAPEEYHHRS